MGRRYSAWLRFAAVVLVVPGCDDSDSERPVLADLPYVSGSRLRARITDGGGGAMLFQGWHDSALDVDCVFRSTADGRVLCVPESGEPSDQPLVDAEIVDEPRGHALSVEVLTASDGAKQLLATRDTLRRAPCELMQNATVGMPEARCIPTEGVLDSSSTSDGFYSDEHCSQQLAETTSAGARYLVRRTTSGEYFTDVHPLGDPVRATHKITGTGECARYFSPAETIPAPFFFPVQPRIPGEALPPATTIAFGGGRLRTILYVAGGETVGSRPGVFRDEARGVMCSASSFEGAAYCGLPHKESTFVFADPECTEPLIARSPSESPPEFAHVEVVGSQEVHVVPVLGAFSGDVVYSLVGFPECSTQSLPTDQLWVTGNPIDPADAFVQVTGRVE